MKTFKTETFSNLMILANRIQNGSIEPIIESIDELLALKTKENKAAWIRELSKLKDTILTGEQHWTIFNLDGNSKLPFAAFSSLPGVTCPGAGNCLDYCYSFRAWRYPAAFCRQAQNAWFMRVNNNRIAAAFKRLPKSIKLRLYVDGDFSSISDVSFWMRLLSARTDVQAYGYSKSFNELLSFNRFGSWPENYLLNVSGGHNHSAEIVDQVKALPITRGTFDAVSIGRKVKANDHGTINTNRALFAAAGKAFPCPGRCGDCRNGDHACGSRKLSGIPIVIAVH